MREKPVIDLSQAWYDTLEHNLSQRLSLKVILLRDWTPPPPNGLNAYSPHNPVAKTALESLRAYLYDRDPQICGGMSDNELNALAANGHITLRADNATPPHAVIVRDERFLDPGKLKQWLTGLQDFSDAYDYKRRVPVNNFIENVNIDRNDARAYEAMRRVRYALRHQNDYDNTDRNIYYMPGFYGFAALSPYGGAQGPYEEGCSISYQALRDMYKGDKATDPGGDFMETLLLARSLCDLQCFSIHPMRTLARLTSNDHPFGKGLNELEFNLHQFHKFQEDLEKKIITGCVRNTKFYAAQDLRVRVPVFREIYKSGTWNKTEQAYLDTIWKGVERFLPTLAKAPVPVLTTCGRLPDSSAGYQKLNETLAPTPPSLSGPA